VERRCDEDDEDACRRRGREIEMNGGEYGKEEEDADGIDVTEAGMRAKFT